MILAVGIAAITPWLMGTRRPPATAATGSAEIETEAARREIAGWRARVQEVLDHPELMHTLFQPIVDLSSGHVAGVEALTRFSPEPVRPPDEWFADAARAGLRIPLELRALRMACGQLDLLPPGYLAVNLSPAALVSPEFARMLGNREGPFERTVIELTEQVPAGSYRDLVAILSELRAAGGRLAVDDGGSGYTNLQQILELRPDFIKLDRTFVTEARRDPARRALVHAVVDFASEIGATVIAEGVENEDELRTVRAAGINLAQGYLFGKPTRPPVSTEWVTNGSRPLEALVVDDDAVVRALIVRIVRRAGITVTGQAVDGENAIREAAQLRPDLVILDLDMPVLSGRDALPAIRAQLPHALILVVSARQPGTAEQMDSLREIGADRHIPKDLVVKHLPSILTSIVNSHEAEHSPRTAALNGD